MQVFELPFEMPELGKRRKKYLYSIFVIDIYEFKHKHMIHKPEATFL